MLLRDGEVAESSRQWLVVRIRDTSRHGTGTSGLQVISHSDDEEEDGG